MYSIDWARLRSVVAEKEMLSGPYLAPPRPSHEPLLLESFEDVPGDPIFVGQVTRDPKSVADRAGATIRRLFQVQGSLARLEGDHLEFLLRTHAYDDLGYSSFRDFVREELQMSSRTATRRVALSRLMRGNEILSRAVDEGRLSPCQVLALEPVIDSPELEEWVQRAAGLTVRELSAALKEPESAVDVCDPAGRKVIFGATASAAYVWDHGIELARRVLGWDAPTHKCIEAVLAEAATELCAETGPGMKPQSPVTRHPSTPRDVLISEEPAKTLQWSERFEALNDSLATSEEELKIIQEISRSGPESAERSLEFVRGVQRRSRCQRILFAQILQDADAAGVIAFWGYQSTRDFLIEELKVSERTAARYMSEAWTFDDNAALSHAYCSGRIGLGQAYLVNRVASSSTLSAFIRRAEAVTHLQFEQEVLFLERLAEYWPTLARRFPGPLPNDMLEHALREGLRELGWSGEELEQKFGLIIPGDPASSPMIMERLESLLETFVLALEERDMAVRDGMPMLASEDETAAPPTLASEGETSSLPTLATKEAARSLSVVSNQSLPTLATGQRTTTISFWAPEPLITQWNEAISVVQVRHGPLPTWVAAIFILQLATKEWERLDLSRRPTEWKILERDKWHCQAPGCSSRRRLEVHHIVFRSHGGPDTPQNLTTLCHAHHQHGIHGKGLHLEGAAPDALHWRLGKDKWFHGFRRTQGRPTLVGLQEAMDISEKAE